MFPMDLSGSFSSPISSARFKVRKLSFRSAHDALRRRLFRCAFVLLALLASHGAKAQTDLQAQYTRRIWNIQDGLPEETVQAIRQTLDGYLWVGTTGGLVRFDGSRFIRFLRAKAPVALPDVSIFCILAAHDGTLWLGTEGGGLLHVSSDGTFRAYTAADGLTDGFVRSVIEDSRHRIWVGTDNGLFRIVHDKVESVDTSPYTSLAVHAIFEDHQHRVWVGGSQLLVFDAADAAQGFTQYRLPGAFSQNRVKSIDETSDGTLWVGTVGGLSRLVDGRFQSVHGITGTVRTLMQTTDGILWIGTIGHGLYTYRDGALSQISSNGLLPSKTVLSIFEDDTRQIWVGTQDGLIRLSRTPVSVIPLPGGSDPDYQTISYDPDGTIWVVASGVYAIHDGIARPYHFAALPNVPVRNVYRDRAHTLWIGTDGSGAYHLTPAGTIHYSAPGLLVNNFIRAFLQAQDGSMWIATDEGVSRISKDRVQNLRVHDGLTYFSTRALMEDSDHGIWIGTDHGLSHWRSGAFQHDAATEGLREEKVWSILQDDTGYIWFGTRDHGLFRYRAGQLTQYTTAQGMAGNSVYQILEDRRQNLWLSGPNSISSFPLARLHAQSSQQRAFLGVTVYDMPYSADGAQMYGGRQPSGCLGPDGGVWFPSNKGAVHVVPEPQQTYAPPRILITSVVSDGRDLFPNSPLSLPASSSRLEIAFSPLMLRPQESIRFRYRLDGFDSQWTYARDNREATYTNLPAGKYTLRIAAFEVNHPEAASEVSLALTKQQYFYRTWWFLGISLLALSLVAWGIYRARIRTVALRFQAVLEERSRVAREMHDTVIQGCTSISALLEGVSSIQSEDRAIEKDLLDYARIQVRTTIDEARQAVWNLRHNDEPTQDFSHSIALIAEHTQKEFGMKVECIIAGKAFPLHGPIARELLMVAREAVYNAALHGHPQRIAITLAYDPDELRLIVDDNGTGFNPNLPNQDGRQHYGIAGMRERIERICGEIDLHSTEGKGTTVAVRVSRTQFSTRPARPLVEL